MPNSSKRVDKISVKTNIRELLTLIFRYFLTGAYGDFRKAPELIFETAIE